MENVPKKMEYRFRDYIVSAIQTFFMDFDKMEEYRKKRFPGSDENLDLCDLIAKERYQRYLKNKKQEFQRSKDHIDYKV